MILVNFYQDSVEERVVGLEENEVRKIKRFKKLGSKSGKKSNGTKAGSETG